MEPIGEALQLLKRQAAIQHSLRRDSPTRVIEERELYLIRQRLNRYPAALQAIAFAAGNSTAPPTPSPYATYGSSADRRIGARHRLSCAARLFPRRPSRPASPDRASQVRRFTGPPAICCAAT